MGLAVRKPYFTKRQTTPLKIPKHGYGRTYRNVFFSSFTPKNCLKVTKPVFVFQGCGVTDYLTHYPCFKKQTKWNVKARLQRLWYVKHGSESSRALHSLWMCRQWARLNWVRRRHVQQLDRR